jgi:hypothetical protein
MPWIFATVARYSSSGIAVKSSADSVLAALGRGVAAAAALGHCSIPVFVAVCVAATVPLFAGEFSPDGCVGDWTGAAATDPAKGRSFTASSDA